MIRMGNIDKCDKLVFDGFLRQSINEEIPTDLEMLIANFCGLRTGCDYIHFRAL